MVIDVIDLDFETLDFSKSYDSNRYHRGTTIYNQRKVTIKKVEDKGNKEYTIDARVRGNYDNYNTMLDISGDIITKCSCTCEDFDKGNLCKHIIATSMEVIEPHCANTKEGIKRLEQKERENFKKRIEEEKKRQEEERKMRIYERKYREGIDLINKYKPRNSVHGNSVLNLKELYEDVQEQKDTGNQTLMTGIKLECIMKYEDTDTLTVNFKVGQSRMYVLSNLLEFYEAYQNETPIYYGKQLNFIPKRSNFVPESQPLFDFIIKYAEMLEYSRKYSDYGRYSSMSSKEIFVTGDSIEDLLKINNNGIIVDTYNKGKITYNFTNQKLEIKCILKKEEVITHYYGYWYEEDEEESVEYVLRLNIKDYYLLESNKKLYVFYKNKIYTFEKDSELMNKINLFKDEKQILIPEDRLEEFQQFVFPKIKHLEIEESAQNQVKTGEVVDKLASKMLLDIDDYGNILLELVFCYGDLEFNVLHNNHLEYVEKNKIIRDIPQETAILKNMFTDGFEIESGRKNFIMKDEGCIYDFLLYKISDYMNDFEVLATEKFKNKQIKQPKIPNIGIRVDNGLLELDISKLNIDMEELKNVLKDYTIKKKYYKLKNGDFLDLTQNQDLDLLEDITTTLDVDYSKIENGVVKLPVNRSVYLEKLLGNNNNVSKNKDYVQIVENIDNPEISDDIKMDEEFENTLREYQKVGYKWLKTLEKYKFGGILADDMGLGKTLQIIAVLKDELTKQSKIPSIVVCPSTLALNWKSEVEKWCKDIKALIISGSVDERADKIESYKDYNLIITSYDLLKRDIANYEDKYFKYIIADEAQYIKNSNTQNATSLKSLQGEIKFALTGTPIENSVAELWSIFDFIMPGYLYNYNKFKKKFEEPILKEENADSLIKLKKLISPFVLRRVKSDVLTELPEKNVTVMKNEMEKEQEKIYLSYLAQTKEEVAKEINGNGFEKSKFKILMLLTRLRQICCHPSLFIENYKDGSGKLNQCMDILTDAIESGHKILLFSSYTSMFDIIEKELKKLGVEYFKLAGDTPVNKRVNMVEEFNSRSDVKVFLISLKAGGTGLNLTSADVVIHYDPWWNVSSENQATDRAYRMGQKNSVQVYKLITSNSIEEKINKMQERKEQLSKDILSTEETFINNLSKEEILDLFD